MCTIMVVLVVPSPSNDAHTSARARSRRVFLYLYTCVFMFAARMLCSILYEQELDAIDKFEGYAFEHKKCTHTYARARIHTHIHRELDCNRCTPAPQSCVQYAFTRFQSIGLLLIVSPRFTSRLRCIFAYLWPINVIHSIFLSIRHLLRYDCIL